MKKGNEKEKKVGLMVRIPNHLHKEIKRLAAIEDTSMNKKFISLVSSGIQSLQGSNV